MSRASEAKLSKLHGVVADALMDELDRAIARAAAAPDDAGAAISPQLLDKIMKFLAQNGIDSPALAEKIDKHIARVSLPIELDDDRLH